MSPKHLPAILILVLTLLAAGCGSDDEGPDAGAATSRPAASGGSAEKIPPALTANREQANEILPEGNLDDKLAELKGFPVVVNQWGSWCPPCRDEFPYFGASAEDHAAEIGFVGIDMQDERGAAEDFLEEFPVPFPSIDDPDAKQIASLGGGVVSPTTVFIDERGEIVEVFQGVYTSQAQLEADIDRHLLKN